MDTVDFFHGIVDIFHRTVNFVNGHSGLSGHFPDFPWKVWKVSTESMDFFQVWKMSMEPMDFLQTGCHFHVPGVSLIHMMHNQRLRVNPIMDKLLLYRKRLSRIYTDNHLCM